MDDPTTAGVTEGFGLMFYNARWYDPYIGRFAQADSIIPPGAQGLDRYAYVNNSPLNYTDPSGHDSISTNGSWNQVQADLNWQATNPNGVLTVNAQRGALVGALVGGTVGAIAGGIAGFFIGSVLGPPGSVAGGLSGAEKGAIAGAVIGAAVGTVVGYGIETLSAKPKEDVESAAALMSIGGANASDGTVDYYFEQQTTVYYDAETCQIIDISYGPMTLFVYDEYEKKWLSYTFQSESGKDIVLETFKKYRIEPDIRFKQEEVKVNPRHGDN